jgi:mitochondrial-processing peptidase subunit alpha
MNRLKDELSRAKTQLQSMLFMNLEQRPVLFEDVARQVLSQGKREQAKYYFDRIEAVTEGDIKRVATRMLESPVAVAALGRLGNVQPYDLINKILNNNKSPLTSSRLFRST